MKNLRSWQDVYTIAGKYQFCIPVIPIWQHLTEIPEKQADLKDDNGIVLNMTVVMMLILLIGETY